ncbi:hypothetical protein CLAIMM_03363 [Cladophialophora immunda]|nr:hypothetical protein CLAIMM_03363 [Cladophialophora immunda]
MAKLSVPNAYLLMSKLSGHCWALCNTNLRCGIGKYIPLKQSLSSPRGIKPCHRSCYGPLSRFCLRVTSNPLERYRISDFYISKEARHPHTNQTKKMKIGRANDTKGPDDVGVDNSIELNQQPVEIRRGSLIPLHQIHKARWERSWPVIASGAGLFSDGYVQSVIGSVNTILGRIYGDRFTNSPQRKNVNAIAFAGTVVGQLTFGILSDYWSRKKSLLTTTVILIIFSALSAGAYGDGGSLNGMLAALTAYRFLVGIGIGGEYPAGSVSAAEGTAELKKGHRNRWFIFFTDFQIDLGFVVGTLVPMILVLIFTEKHLRAVWRVALGLGVLPPMSLFYLRLKLKEPEQYNSQRMTKYPYWLILKFYGFRLAVVSTIWFIYDFLTYSFSIYSSSWTAIIIGNNAPLWVVLGWSTLINAFYVPGSFVGAFLSDWIGPKNSLVIGVTLQGIIGFIMSGIYGYLDTPAHVAGFVVVYGIFLATGEIGPGDNIGLIASKTCATAIRGQYSGIAAAFGKIGAFVGTYLFPLIQDDAGSDLVKQGQYPFYVSSALCFLSAIIAFFLLPNIGQDEIEEEDIRFRAYLEANGFDTRTMGEGGVPRQGAEFCA